MELRVRVGPFFCFFDPFFVLKLNLSFLVESQSTTEMKESLSSFSSPGINHNEAAQSSQRVRGMNSHQLDQVSLNSSEVVREIFY